MKIILAHGIRKDWERIGEPWPFDHFEEVGHNLDLGLDVKHQETFHLRKYEEIMEQLRSLEM
ncbi:MAG: hypothetical protein L0Y67_09250 [Gammaproteobacteria bacterium]|nr:hypothetical protein [Gammaproteobacteria bacterium]